ncbi:MAG: S-layer homology domain-containing protein [Lachnospiraceae bacterium]|nr:S-layer homology domain-containing protein [Lachnospiraceae bacterium]
MRKNVKKIVSIVLAMVLALIILPIGSLTVRAEEPDLISELETEPDVLGVSYKVGDIIKFGHYEQDGNTSNGKEEIEWEVLKVESDRVLVVSKYALDCKPYNTEYTDVTWETCTLRKWLNNDFKNAAFTSAEQAKIPTVTVVNENNPYYGTAGGNNTKDQIFCLSVNEIKNLIGYNWYSDQYMYGYSQKMIVEPTQYAINNGAYVYTITESDYNSYLKDYGYTSDVIGRRGAWWWLRSPGSDGCYACLVYYYGYAGACFDYSVRNDDGAVRPALYFLNPTTVNPKSINLNTTSATMYYGDSLTLTATVLPADATDKSVTWSSSNPAVATVSGGVVKATGKQAGTTIITAKTVNGLTATCEVTVYADNNSSNIFADIKYGNWQYKAAKAVYDKGYMTGTGSLNGRVVFTPNLEINRSQFVTALYSMEGKPEVTYKQQFFDVKNGDWFAKPVTWASDNGIVAGNPDGSYGVNGKATREQLALMFYKYAQYKNYDVSVKASTTLDGFTDAGKVSSWAVTAVKWAVERGIISGKGNESEGLRINPKQGATRIECAAMMNRFDEVYKNALKAGIEEIEEPLALPEEEMEDNPASKDGMEEDLIPEEQKEEDVIPEEETEDAGDDEKADSEEEADEVF